MLSEKQYIQQSAAHCKTKAFEKALPLIKEGLSYYPNNDVLLGLLASCYAELGMQTEAKATFEQLLQVNPKNYLAMHQLGLLCFQQQNWQQALDHWQVLLQQPNDYVTKYYAAVAKLQLQQVDAAVALLNDAKNKVPAGHPIDAEIVKLQQQLSV